MRSTRTIDTPHGPMLFSPVLVHELEPGESADARARLPRLVDLLGVNDPILRAVGASSRRRAR